MILGTDFLRLYPKLEIQWKKKQIDFSTVRVSMQNTGKDCDHDWGITIIETKTTIFRDMHI